MHEECRRSVPALTAVLAELRRTTRLVAFVADTFGVDSMDAARDAGVERRCLFMPVNLHSIALIFHLPEVLASVPGEFWDLEEPVRLPGCVPIPGTDILATPQDRSSPAYGSIVHIAARCRWDEDADALLVNTFDAVEPEAATVLRERTPGRPPVFSIGPLIRTASQSQSHPRAACLEWLDRQPAESLELSGQRFLWVVRSPSDILSDNYYDAASKKDPFAYLPEGFVERTNDVGFVVPSWAPQTEVLGHDATTFMSAGGTQTGDILVHGVPMLAWPLFAKEDERGGAGGGGWSRDTAIAAAVRELMVMRTLVLPSFFFLNIEISFWSNISRERGIEGAVVRAKVVELQKAAAEGFREGGAATVALDEVVQSWVGEK
ncbi:LOW QUALITY PROTEIN: hypothetical protein U9M48_002320 [Paspalum notatum var. saurae]|uniref:UDP-glycosyltransferase n=1 Tax=Paspalum notatum var. saurae TaxID=547442 RepID=A0AAQ3SHD4_PASNO